MVDIYDYIGLNFTSIKSDADFKMANCVPYWASGFQY